MTTSISDQETSPNSTTIEIESTQSTRTYRRLESCLYCQADHPFTLRIPGLDGRLCECGNWIADCPSCRQWRSELLAIGICVDCKLARDLAKAERKRKRRRKLANVATTAKKGATANV